MRDGTNLGAAAGAQAPALTAREAIMSGSSGGAGAPAGGAA
jgi:hypothetical protein